MSRSPPCPRLPYPGPSTPSSLEWTPRVRLAIGNGATHGPPLLRQAQCTDMAGNPPNLLGIPTASTGGALSLPSRHAHEPCIGSAYPKGFRCLPRGAPGRCAPYEHEHSAEEHNINCSTAATLPFVATRTRRECGQPSVRSAFARPRVDSRRRLLAESIGQRPSAAHPRHSDSFSLPACVDTPSAERTQQPIAYNVGTEAKSLSRTSNAAFVPTHTID